MRAIMKKVLHLYVATEGLRGEETSGLAGYIGK